MGRSQPESLSHKNRHIFRQGRFKVRPLGKLTLAVTIDIWYKVIK